MTSRSKVSHLWFLLLFPARVRVPDLRIHLTRLVTRSYRRYSSHRGCEERTRRGCAHPFGQGYVVGLPCTLPTCAWFNPVINPAGADPTNASSQGPPESYTSDPVVLGLLSAANSKMSQQPMQQPEGAYTQEQAVDSNHVDPAANGYYPPPPGAYYYPPMPVPPPMMPDGTVPYYAPPPHMPTDQNPSGLGNLPPPEIARMIPCRYYPACRYGSSCMFAHPQGPYMQGPLPPPTQYAPPYDPMNPPPYPPTYYPVPPGSYGSPNGAPLMSPPPPMAHARSGSEVMSPVQGPFSPSAGQPPVPYGMVSPVSPTYGHPAPVPIPVSVTPLPPLQTSPTSAQAPPPPAMYTPISPSAQGVAPPYAMPPHYPPPPMHPNGEVADVVSPKSPMQGHPQADGYGPGPIPRDMGHHRRGSARRPSFGGRGGKPPCLFFPSGRCRNGYVLLASGRCSEALI